MKYKFIDNITSDVTFEVYGRDIKAILRNSAEALFEVICQIEKIKPQKSIEIVVMGDNLEDLLYNWLNKLIASVDTKEMFFSKFEIVELIEKNKKYKLKAKIHGEDIKPEKGGTVVKAVTYYGFKVEKTKYGYKAVVSCDI